MPAASRGKPCLLAVGFYAPATGLTRVMQAILRPLAADYDVHYIGIGYKGPVQTDGLTLHPCNLHGGDVFGAHQAREFIDRRRPEILLLVNDLWILARYPGVLAGIDRRTAVVGYIPVDGKIVDEQLVAPLTGSTRLVLYTEFARREIEEAGARLAAARPDYSLPPTAVIPHGVDTSLFYPLAGSVDAQLAPAARRLVREQLFAGEPAWQDAFIVLNANRPQPRKRIDLTIEGFARFAAGKPPNVKLYLHHAVIRPEEQAEILRWAERYQVLDRMKLGPQPGQDTSDAELNLIYNACDVGINTAMGEGWGLVSFEHAATTAAQIVPRHSACTELWTGSAELVEPIEHSVPRFSPLEMAAVSAMDVAAALEHLYADAGYRDSLARAAYRNAAQPGYRWDTIAQQWRELFGELVGDRPM
jgi:D-inositol-3-phosphate glycosyltransferase